MSDDSLDDQAAIEETEIEEQRNQLNNVYSLLESIIGDGRGIQASIPRAERLIGEARNTQANFNFNKKMHEIVDATAIDPNLGFVDAQRASKQFNTQMRPVQRNIDIARNLLAQANITASQVNQILSSIKPVNANLNLFNNCRQKYLNSINEIKRLDAQIEQPLSLLRSQRKQLNKYSGVKGLAFKEIKALARDFIITNILPLAAVIIIVLGAVIYLAHIAAEHNLSFSAVKSISDNFPGAMNSMLTPQKI